MRQILKKQPPLLPTWGNHQHNKELQAISNLLDAHPEIAALVHRDVVGDARDDTGRGGLSGEQVLRILLIKQIHNLSYRELAFHLDDSRAFRAFCRLGFADGAPSSSTLQANIKRLRPETLMEINHILVAYAREQGIEKGRTVRADCTVVESNIHEPSDSSLLWDGVRVITRLLGQVKSRWSSLDFYYANHNRRAKRRALNIRNASSARERRRNYRDLLKVAGWVQGYATDCLAQLGTLQGRDALALAEELRDAVGTLAKIIDQTERRVFMGENVPASEKLVSMFEPHTDIIKKQRREIEYGHKIWLCGGKSGLISDCQVLSGNPADVTLAQDIVERQTALYGRPPRQVAFDGGFTSSDNLAAIKQMGVQDVCFHKKRGLEVQEMVKSAWVFKRLRDFRAGIEGVISTLKRAFALDRCHWKGFTSFRAYVHSCVLAFNCIVLARHLIT